MNPVVIAIIDLNLVPPGAFIILVMLGKNIESIPISEIPIPIKSSM